jgi:aryl-alcohol dehydrogenase-like predicted oxidoreductase
MNDLVRTGKVRYSGAGYHSLHAVRRHRHDDLASACGRISKWQIYIGKYERRSNPQLEDNLKAVQIHLTDSEAAALDELTEPKPLYPHWFNKNLVDSRHKEILRPPWS